MHSESTQEITWYVVYDTRTGDISYTHQFIDDGAGAQHHDQTCARHGVGRESMVLDLARAFSDADTLQVMKVPTNSPLECGVTYRVDLTSGEIVQHSKALRGPANFRARMSARDARKEHQCSRDPKIHQD